MAINLFHLPKTRQFKYSPIYYNEQKEELEKQINKAKRAAGVNVEYTGKPYIPNIKGQMRGYFKRSAEQKRKSTFRLVMVFLVLVTIAYFLLYY